MSIKEENLKETVLNAFIDSSLEKEIFPLSVFKFCKENKIEEKTFYKHFSSLEAVKGQIWKFYYDNAMGLLEKDAAYENASPKDKLLSFYFTFFEVLLLNRSYVLFSLSSNQSTAIKMSQLGIMRSSFKYFAEDLIDIGNTNKKESYLQHPPKIFSEGAWIQFAFLIKFWINDASVDFEKTDQAIEKSVQTAFDVFDNTPLGTLVDFGKFLWKEKFVFN
jgi:AcrR family transcriptional regulator